MRKCTEKKKKRKISYKQAGKTLIYMYIYRGSNQLNWYSHKRVLVNYYGNSLCHNVGRFSSNYCVMYILLSKNKIFAFFPFFFCIFIIYLFFFFTFTNVYM